MIFNFIKVRNLYLFILILGLFFSLTKASISAVQAKGRGDSIVIQAMEKELKRSQEKLKLEGYETPYFISYQIKDNQYYSIKGKYGAIVSSDNDRIRRLFVDVRVGNYDFDNSIKGRSGGSVPFHDALNVPVDNDPDAIRAALWQVTDLAYKDALTQYFNKKANNVQKIEDKSSKSFTREKSHNYYGPELNLTFNPSQW